MEISYTEGVWKREETIGKLIRVGPIEAQIISYHAELKQYHMAMTKEEQTQSEGIFREY